MFRWSFLKSPNRPKIVLKKPESEGCMVDLQIDLTPKISKNTIFPAFESVVANERVGDRWLFFFANKMIQLAKSGPQSSSIKNRLV